MAATADIQREMKQSDGILNFAVVNADIIYAGTVVGLSLPGHASAGYIRPYAPAANLCPIGIALDAAVTGDSSATPKPEQSVNVGGGKYLLTVANLAGSIADVGDLVYASADDTFTTTATANPVPLGRVVEWYSATQAWVQIDPMPVLLRRFESP